MPGEHWKRGGIEWQNYVGSLIRRRVPFGDYVEIPDSVRGDCGLEGFSRDGNAFQCYAATEPLDSKALTDKQKRKVTQDLGKLQKNQVTLAKLLHPTQIRNWALVVPRWVDKSLLSHASDKIKEVCAANLSFVQSGCTANILTLDDFAVEAQILARAGAGTLAVGFDEPDETAETEFSLEHDEWLRHLDRKAMTLAQGNPQQAASLAKDFLGRYLRGQNLLDQLRARFPDVYAQADSVKRTQERSLSLHSALHEGTAKSSLREVITEFTGALRTQIPGLDVSTVRDITHEAVADWLLRCPMDFPQ